jgi:hypothetical protein
VRASLHAAQKRPVVTETTVGLAVNKDKMLEAYETGDKAGKLSMLNKGTLTGCRI